MTYSEGLALREQISKKFYEEQIKCSNCSFAGSIMIEKGILISQEECPKCGCKKLSLSVPDYIMK